MSNPFYIERGPVLYVEDPWNPDNFVTVPNFMESIPAIVSFHDFLNWNYKEDYNCVIRECVENGSVSLGRYLDSERSSIEKIRLNTSSIHKIYLHRTSMTSFRMDVVIIADFTAYFYSGQQIQSTQWYRVQGEYIANDTSNFFKSVSVYQKDDVPDDNPLSEYLVPYLSKHDLDAEAEAMLSEYYPEALTSPTPIDAKELAKRMGYKVKVARLSDDDSKLGAVFMRKSKVTYYRDGMKKCCWVEGKTILIDVEACKSQNRKADDVIVHECIHVYEHFLFYDLQAMYRDFYEIELPGFEDVIDDTLGLDQLNWIENQANHMTPRVRMPLFQASFKAAELFEDCKRYPESVTYKYVIDGMADFFRVSRTAAANRLVEIGYDKARGMMKYANGHPVPGYLVEHGIANNKTYTIDFDKVVEEFDRNAEFRKLLDKGAYIYVEGHLCRNTQKYIWQRNNRPVLSPYARTHMAECCLLFTIRHSGTDYEYIPGALNLNVKKAGKLAYLYDENNNQADAIESSVTILEHSPMTFAATLKYHMDNLGFSKTTLADVSQLSERTITRMRSETKKMPSMSSIIQASIGMKLYPDLTYDMLEKAKRYFESDVPEHRWYRVIIRTMYCESIDTVNRYLESKNVKPLHDDEYLQLASGE